jgi:hypothetical protein
MAVFEVPTISMYLRKNVHHPPKSVEPNTQIAKDNIQ